MKHYTVHDVQLVNVCRNYTNNNCILLMSVMRTQTVWAACIHPKPPELRATMDSHLLD